jgi:RHS repeat-associated protein
VARVELGDKQVQGTDYAYTILGWIKGVNSNTLDKDRDLGKDGSTATGNLNRWFGYDAAAYSLGYFTNDYKSINASLNNSSNWFLASETNDATNGYKQDSYDLYNGNISRMVTSLRDQNGTPIPVQGRTFRYDQLNRIKEVHAWTDAQLISTNNWSTGNATDNNGNYSERFEYDLNGNIELAVREGHLTGTHQHMDRMIYNYVSGTNKLDNVNDIGTALNTDYDMDIDAGQTTGNYGYDAIGNLTSDVSEDIQNIEWNNQGKIVKITRTNTSNKDDLEFLYDASGQRIAKIVKPRVSGVLQPENEWTYTIYSRDATGNVLAVYNFEYKQVASNWQIVHDLKEVHIYGRSRLGVRYDQQTPVTRDFSGSAGTDGTFNLAAVTFSAIVDPSVNTVEFKRELGYKAYELTNHLGNVLATISDRRLPVGSSGVISNFLPEIMTYTDYYVFGSNMPGRKYVNANGKYRYSFNNQESDPELFDGGGLVFEYRIHDPRLGRFLSVDPLSKYYPWNSPYAFAENRVIDGIDLEGLEWAPYDAQGNRLDINQDGWQNNVTEYRWEGYDITYKVTSGKNKGKTYMSEAELKKAGLQYTDGTNGVEKKYTAKSGTVANGIVVSMQSVDPVNPMLAVKSTVYSVTDYNPVENTSYSIDKYLITAVMYMGTTEGDNPTIQGWIDQLNADFGKTDETGKPISDDSGEWCGVFVYACLSQSGVPVTQKKDAQQIPAWQTPALSSFYNNNWAEGVILNNPEMGAIVRMNYSHVGFVVGWDDTYLWILGGNQQPYPAEEDGRGTTVNIRRVKRSQVDDYVAPNANWSSK